MSSARLKGRFKLGIVSNFYGNLDRILEESKLDRFFATVADSSRLGIFKPEPGIFEAALKKIQCAPESAAMIGDSLVKGLRARTQTRDAHSLAAHRIATAATIATLADITIRIDRRSCADSMVTELQGAIIAAGRGERLRGSTRDDIPKPLVMLGGEPMLSRQARAMLAAGASSVVAMINSETARIAKEMSLELPASMRLVVRDTANSMETMLALGEVLGAGMVHRIDGGRCNSTGRTRAFC